MSGRAATTTLIRGKAALSVGLPEEDAPTGWVWTSLYEVAELGTGHTPSRSVPSYWDGDVPWIGIRDAAQHHGGRIGTTLQMITEAGLENSSARLLPAGTVCLSRTASVGYVIQMDRPMATSQDFVTWTCVEEGLDPRFLMYALLAEGDDIRRFGKGTTHTTIYFPEVKAFHICLPPLAEQRRIVAKLDALTARTARARADLDRIPALAARYKQAVLAKVFGELDCEPEKLADLVDPVRGIPYGIVQTGLPVPFGVPTVRCGDVRQFCVEKEGLKIVSQEIADAYTRTRLRGGEVLLAIRGSVGNSAVVGPEFAGCNISREVALIPVGERLRPRFAMFFLGSPEAQSYLKRHVKGVAQTGINLEDVRSLTLPVPELPIQDAVVEKIDRALTEIDRLTAEVVAARRLLDRLDQAVLAKAFRGELVPQDPTDEPASVLLDRIRAERAGAPKAARGRRKAVA